MKNRIFLFFLLVIGITSCKNSDENTLTYYGKLDLPCDSLALYTKNGQIPDSSLINDILRRYGVYRLATIHPTYTATILNSSSLVLSCNSIQPSTFHDTLKIIESDSIIYWERMHKTNETLVRLNIFKYWPQNATITYNSNRITISNVYNYCYYLKRDGEDLLMPIVTYLYIKGEYKEFGTEKNEFDPSCLVRFGDADTIIINRYNIRFKAE